jgi:hypothetical protein
MLSLIKQASVEAVEERSPVAVLFGVVAELDPVTIKVDERFMLEDEQLIPMPPNQMEALEEGDSLLLLRVQGGEKYVIWRKVE